MQQLLEWPANEIGEFYSSTSAMPAVVSVAAIMAVIAGAISYTARREARKRAEDQIAFDSIKYWIENNAKWKPRQDRINFFELLSDRDILQILGQIHCKDDIILKPKDPLIVIEYTKHFKSKVVEYKSEFVLVKDNIDEVREDILDYMNKLEYICIPYKLGLMNRKIFFNEMQNIYGKNENNKLFQRLFKIMDQKSWWPSMKYTTGDFKKRMDKILSRAQLVKRIRSLLCPRFTLNPTSQKRG